MPIDGPNILVIWGDDIGITNLSCTGMSKVGPTVHESLHHRPRSQGTAEIPSEGFRNARHTTEHSCHLG
ncbi:MAG: hypothetical protein QOC63_5151 [Mycobacterium sp.]|jgi:arylsulfatase A-like enzyme|nr:hypothetical protein [Mycobacterium sp.]